MHIPAFTRTYTRARTLLTYTCTCAVPSGHILTKEELQVLGAILATQSDEQLKSIQLTIQEEQEIRDISREEVEKYLRQSGLASKADGLKDNIEKGIAWLLTLHKLALAPSMMLSQSTNLRSWTYNHIEI